MIRAFFSALLAVQIGSALAAEPRPIQSESARFVGATGCKSSSCHGGAGEKRRQYITWVKQDFHTRGYAILTTARSERMAEALNLPPAQAGANAAPTSARCTVCHSPFQALPAARRPLTADPTESVSCESCHGAAGNWLRGHTRPDWTYATRVGAGLRDLKSFYVRANTCVACHQNLDADLSAAGHPDLVFELARQSDDQPKHWRDPAGSDVRAWLVGQAVALRETSWKLAQTPAGNEQTFAQWQGLNWLLAKITAADKALLPIEGAYADGAAADFARVQTQADALARRAARQNLDPPFTRRLLRALAETGGDFTETATTPRPILFRRAQRLVLAVEALAAGNQALAEDLTKLGQDVRTLDEFDPEQFAAHLVKLRNTLGAQ